MIKVTHTVEDDRYTLEGLTRDQLASLLTFLAVAKSGNARLTEKVGELHREAHEAVRLSLSVAPRPSRWPTV